MNMPGYGAEASLGRARQQYGGGRPGPRAEPVRRVVPAQTACDDKCNGTFAQALTFCTLAAGISSVLSLGTLAPAAAAGYVLCVGAAAVNQQECLAACPPPPPGTGTGGGAGGLGGTAGGGGSPPHQRV